MKKDKMLNPDGIPYDPPILPEYRELMAKFPPCSYGISYSCMFCHNCPNGDYFKFPKEAEPILEKQMGLTRAYLSEHGAKSILDLILPTDIK